MYQRILVGVDGSATAARAAGRAVEVAKATGARLTLLGVGAPARLQPVLDDLAKQHAPSGVDIETRVVEGDPATRLVEVAGEDGYDLLVVGNKGMTGATRFLLGSVPNKVSHHAHSAILIVHTT